MSGKRGIRERRRGRDDGLLLRLLLSVLLLQTRLLFLLLLLLHREHLLLLLLLERRHLGVHLLLGSLNLCHWVKRIPGKGLSTRTYLLPIHHPLLSEHGGVDALRRLLLDNPIRRERALGIRPLSHPIIIELHQRLLMLERGHDGRGRGVLRHPPVLELLLLLLIGLVERLGLHILESEGRGRRSSELMSEGGVGHLDAVLAVHHSVDLCGLCGCGWVHDARVHDEGVG